MQTDKAADNYLRNAGRRPLRLLGCLVAAYVFLDPSVASAVAPADVAPSVAAVGRVPDGLATAAGQICHETTGVIRSAARGTLPDTGAGRSLPPLFAAAGLLVGGLAFRAAAARLRRRQPPA